MKGLIICYLDIMEVTMSVENPKFIILFENIIITPTIDIVIWLL
jgi:hypothetical protein